MPSSEVREQSLQICRKIAVQINQFMVEGCLADAMKAGEKDEQDVEHLGIQEIEDLQAGIIQDANDEDKPFMRQFVNTQMFNQYVEENCELKTMFTGDDL